MSLASPVLKSKLRFPGFLVARCQIEQHDTLILKRAKKKILGRFREQRKWEIFLTYLSYWLVTEEGKKREYSLGCMPFPRREAACRTL